MVKIKRIQLNLTPSEFDALEMLLNDQSQPSSGTDMAAIILKVAQIRSRLDKAAKLLERIPRREG